MATTLFEDAVPADTARIEESAFTPIQVDGTTNADPSQWWDDLPMPAAWLLMIDGRAKLIEYAIEAVYNGTTYAQNKSELSENAGVSRHSVIRYIDDLVAFGIYEEHGEKRSRYAPNEDSRVLAALDAANDELLDCGHVPDKE